MGKPEFVSFQVAEESFGCPLGGIQMAEENFCRLPGRFVSFINRATCGESGHQHQ